MKLTALSLLWATTLLTHSSVTATSNWRKQPPFPCPGNIPNDCTPIEQTGFDFSDLPEGVFTSYKGYSFKGFKCGRIDTPLKPNFPQKCISADIFGDLIDAAIIRSPDTKRFSIGEMDISTDIRGGVDVELHYTMPKGEVCKQKTRCLKEGNTVVNTQCGGAVEVKMKIGKGQKVKKCQINIHKIRFVCGKDVTIVPEPTTTLVPSITRPPAPVQTCGVPGKPDCTPAQTCGVPGKPECTSCGTPGKPDCPPPAPTCGVSGKPDCPSPSGSSITTTPTSREGTTTTVPPPPAANNSTIAIGTTATTQAPPPPKQTCGVAGKPDCPSCGVPGKPDCPPPPAPTCGVPGTPDCPTCGVPGKPDCPPIPNPPTNGTATTTSTSTTVLPPSTLITTTTTKPTTTTLPPPVLTTILPPPPPQNDCPDLVPKCLKTWLFKTPCTDTADAQCFCPVPGFFQEIVDCIQAWGSSDAEIAKGLSYFLGLCSGFVKENPSVVTCIPDTITLPPPPQVTATNTATVTVPAGGGGAPPPVPQVTITQVITKIIECDPVTVTVGPNKGEVITETTTVIRNTLTIPDVQLVVTKTEVEMIYPPVVTEVPGPVPSTRASTALVTVTTTRGPSGSGNETVIGPSISVPVEFDGNGAGRVGGGGLLAAMVVMVLIGIVG